MAEADTLAEPASTPQNLTPIVQPQAESKDDPTSAKGSKNNRFLRRGRFVQFRDLAVGISSVISAVAIPVVGYWVSAALKNKEIEGQFVELAVNILKEEPSANQRNLRKWATEVINKNSGVALSEEATSDLINRTVIPSPNLDPRTASTLGRLQPNAAQLARQLIEKAMEKGIVIKLLSGLRTIEEQNALYAQGRTKPGQVVTHARGGSTVHNTGLAFDIGVFREDKFIQDSDPIYDTIGELGRSLGLIWGGDWQTFPDRPHFETPDAKDALKQLKASLPSAED
jgi:peptidoglycan LD-endopeptidase CwlK